MLEIIKVLFNEDKPWYPLANATTDIVAGSIIGSLCFNICYICGKATPKHLTSLKMNGHYWSNSYLGISFLKREIVFCSEQCEVFDKLKEM